MKKIHKMWKMLFLLLAATVGCALTITLTNAATVQVIISGDYIDEGVIWDTNQGVVRWNATAFDNGTELPLGAGGSITWESSNPSVVLASGTSTSGNVSSINLQAVGTGTATIRAIYNGPDGSGNIVRISAEKNIKVGLKVANVPAYVFEDNAADYTVNTNSNDPLLWSSSNENVATVVPGSGGKGVISFHKGGVAKITCRTQDGTQEQSFEVVVNARFTEADSDIVIPYDGTYTLQTNTGGKLYFASDNTNVVTVNSYGAVRGVGAGAARVHVYAVDKSSPWFDKITDRTVLAHVDFKILGSDRNIAVGDTLELSTNIGKDYANGVNWNSSDTSVATVNNGVVTTKKKGKVTIRASVINSELFGSAETQTAEITVNVVDGFALSETEHTINAGDTFLLSALATDDIAEVTWSSDNENVVKVTAQEVTDGAPFSKAVITAVAKGTATITATQTVNGISRTATCKVTVNIPVEGVSIYPTGPLDLTIGESYPLRVIFRPADADNQKVIWASGNESIIEVDNEGWVTAVGPGTANVLVISEDGHKGASITVNVSEPLTGVSLTEHKIVTSMLAGTYQMVYTITPDSDGVNKNVTWHSSDPSVATVDENGLVTFVSPGIAVISVQTKGSAIGDDGKFYNLIDQCTFHVQQPVEQVALDENNLTLKVSDTYRCNVTVLPEDADNKKLIWESTDPKVATVDANGLVKAVGSGNCTITVKSQDNGLCDDFCNIMVYQPVTEMAFSADSYTIKETDRLYLQDYLTVLPGDASEYTLTWVSDKPAVVTVDANKGTCVGIKEGRAYITVTCTNNLTNETHKIQCIINVTARIKGIRLNSTSKTIYKGKTFTLKPTVTPGNAQNYTIIWSSSDASVASVKDGVVTGKKRGTAIITAKVAETSLAAKCRVTVKEKVEKLSISGSSHYINKGKTRTLKAVAKPTTANNRKVKWWSGNKKILKVNQSGRVTAVGAYGKSAYIYCRTLDGSKKTAKYKLRIVRRVTKIKVSPSKITLLEGETKQLSKKVTPANATVRSVKWKSSNPAVATVDEDGQVTAISKGTCKIYATSNDGNKVKGSCRVNVKKGVPATAVRLNTSNMTMISGQTRKLTARLVPSNTTESYTWYSSDTSVAQVSKKGVITARGQGTAEIYAVSNASGVESSCTVTVLALNAASIVLEQYDKYDLDVFGSSGTVRWYTSNRRVAIVSRSGVVTAKMAGTAIITAKANGKVLQCRVRVLSMKK